MTHVLLFFFLLGAFCFFAGVAVAGTLQFVGTRGARPGEVYVFLRLAPVGIALVGIGGLLTLGFGIALVQHEEIGFSKAWIQAALGLLATSIVLGLYGGRMVRHTRSLTRRRPATEGDVPSEELGSPVGARAPLWASGTSGILLLAILGLAVWRPTGSATASYASSTVPVNVQQAIAHRFPQFAYLPTRLPHGLHYTSYDGVRGFEFNMWFSSRGGATTAALEYGVTVADCAAQAPPMQSFTVNGVDVSWSGDYTNQRAWRCITRGRTSLVVSAGRSVEGDANPIETNTLTQKQNRDALELAQVVAYAEPIR